MSSRPYPLVNLARMTVSSSGTGNITLAAAVSGFLTFDLAGCSTGSSGQEITYSIYDVTQSEIATGTYFSSSLLLQRSTAYMKSTNGDAPINMSNASQVMITLGSHDLKRIPTTTILTSTAGGAYAPPMFAVALEIWGVGGGQGGQGGNRGTTYTSSGETTSIALSTTTLTATGGSSAGVPGVGAGANLINASGGAGGIPLYAASINQPGANGGDSYFGRGGKGSLATFGSSGGIGSGGGGGSAATGSSYSGWGGGAGGSFWHLEPISSISSAISYTYAIAAGSAGSSGSVVNTSGGAGANGQIVIREYYLG
jgi:hypothetical protein